MTAIFKKQVLKKPWPAARDEPEIFAQTRQATKSRVDEPQSIVTKCHIMGIDVTGMVSRTRKIEGVVFARLIEGQVSSEQRSIGKQRDIMSSREGQLSWPNRQAHRLIE